MEIWKTITDYPNYQVSNYGNVKNIMVIMLGLVILMIKLNLRIILL